MNIRTPRISDKTLLRRLDIFLLTFGIFDFTAQFAGDLSEMAQIQGLTLGPKRKGRCSFLLHNQKPYFFQDRDLNKIQKIIKCEATTTGR